MKKGRSFILSGPSGVGKTTIFRSVLKQVKNLKPIITYTTRKIRKGEKDGRNYYFVSKRKFKQMIRNHEFIEYVNYCENLYGTRKKDVDKLLKKHNVLFHIEVNGTRKIKRLYKNTKTIFILPPSMIELERRLRNRSSETEEAIMLRLQTCKKEIKEAIKYDYRIINEDLDKAISDVKAIIEN